MVKALENVRHSAGCNSLLRKSLAAKRRGMRKGNHFVFFAFLAAVIHNSLELSKSELHPREGHGLR
jgi:hypothetical protein